MRGQIIGLVGAQWGDEGKGRLVDSIGREIDVFARYQGGANAGHTVIVGDRKYVFHLLPSGMLYAGKTCIIGSGVVFDPDAFFKELELLVAQGMDRARLLISGAAHVVMPYHQQLDQLQEKEREKNGAKIGTTGRGIGPCYADKISRCGIRVEDLLDPAVLRCRLEQVLQEKNRLFTRVYDEAPMAFDPLFRQALHWGEKLKSYVADVPFELEKSLKEGETVLLEGAQGIMLDLDYGTYPMVTSSTTLGQGGLASLGLDPRCMSKMIGVAKAYVTRVGEGAFPTEDFGEDGELLRQRGHEFGATTGRPRRCGWFDLVAMKYAIRVSAITELVITKLDVLSGFDQIKVCDSYFNDDEQKVVNLPLSELRLKKMRPHYRIFEGWKEDISSCRNFDDLPRQAKEYLVYLSKELGLPLTFVGVGPERDQLIRVDNKACQI